MEDMSCLLPQGVSTVQLRLSGPQPTLLVFSIHHLPHCTTVLGLCVQMPEKSHTQMPTAALNKWLFSIWHPMKKYCFVKPETSPFNSMFSYPKHLSKVRVPEAERDVGHVKAFGGPFIVCVDPGCPSTTSSPWADAWLTVNLRGAIWLLEQRDVEERKRTKKRSSTNSKLSDTNISINLNYEA